MKAYQPREMILNPHLMRNVATSLSGYTFKYPNTEHIQYGITYSLNNYAYRCDDFPESINNDDILYTGCSHTYAYGLPLKYSWAYQVNKAIGNNKFYNIAMPGRTFFSIIYEAVNFIEKFGSPGKIFMLLPNIERFSVIGIKEYSSPRYAIEYVSLAMPSASAQILDKNLIKDDNELDIVLSVLNNDIMAYEFVSLLKFFEAYCKLKNIKFYWSTWDILLSNAIRFAGYDIFDNYFELGDFDEYAKENIVPPKNLGEDKYLWLKAADSPHPHPGIMEQSFYAKRFLEEFGGK